MPEEFDISKYAAELTKYAFGALADNAVQPALSAYAKRRVRQPSWFRERLFDSLSRYSSTRTLLFRDQPRLLSEFYVPLTIRGGDKLIRTANAAKLLEAGRRHLILGTGGCGKSMLMRHLYLDVAKTGSALPVFIELRRATDSNATVLQLLLEELFGNSDATSDSLLAALAASGKLWLFFDGFDELAREQTKRIAKEIQQLARHWTKVAITVSSRPDDQFVGWGSFVSWNVQPLELREACSLVEKLGYDQPVSTKFVQALKSGLYNSHRELLANPLLLSIMLLTFQDTAGIPAKRYLFYAAAFEALFTRHDATKTGYKRDVRSSLASDDFAKAIAALCAVLFSNRKWLFTQQEFAAAFGHAKNISRCDCDADSFLYDLTTATCLVVREGVRYAFVHRSFQEYFTAVFVKDAPFDSRQQLLRLLLDTTRQDSVLDLLYDMDPDLVHRELIAPRLRQLKSDLRIGQKITQSAVVRFAKKLNWAIGPSMAVGDDEAELTLYHGGSDELMMLCMFLRTRVFAKRGIGPKMSEDFSATERLFEIWKSRFGPDWCERSKGADVVSDSEICQALRSTWCWIFTDTGLASLMQLERDISKELRGKISVIDALAGGDLTLNVAE